MLSKKIALFNRVLFVCRCFVFVSIAVGVGLLYVWQNVQIVKIGYQMKKNEKSIIDLVKTKRLLETELAALKMPKRIQMQVKNSSMPLELSDNWQVVHINETPFFYLDDFSICPQNEKKGNLGHTIINIAKLKLTDKDAY